jgi:hypothetical protein
MRRFSVLTPETDCRWCGYEYRVSGIYPCEIGEACVQVLAEGFRKCWSYAVGWPQDRPRDR